MEYFVLFLGRIFGASRQKPGFPPFNPLRLLFGSLYSPVKKKRDPLGHPATTVNKLRICLPEMNGVGVAEKTGTPA
jgi:hypothetical protein